MCGMVGIAGKLEAKDEKTLQRLLMYDYFRGPDSTGFAAVRNTKDVKLAKVSSHPLDLFDMNAFKSALSGYNSTVFLGHNRAATKGAITSANAHPFTVDHITGMHNGTLFEAAHKALEEKLGEKYQVDSRAIIAAIARFGIEEVVPMLQGAWSLIWYNSNDNTLNFLRNKERPMWYAYTKAFDRIFWASEWPTMDAAIRQSALGYEMYEESDKYGYFSTEEDIWYSYDVDVLKAGSKDRPKPKAKKLKGKEVVAASSNHDPFLRPTPSPTGVTNGGRGKTQTGRSTTSSGQSSVDFLDFDGKQSNPYSGFISLDKFVELARHGCSWCEKPLIYGEPVTWCENDDILRCEDCSNNPVGSSRLLVSNFRQLL